MYVKLYYNTLTLTKMHMQSANFHVERIIHYKNPEIYNKEHTEYKF